METLSDIIKKTVLGPETLRAVFVPVAGRPRIVEIPNHLGAIQWTVGGNEPVNVEPVSVVTGNGCYVALVDSEGKLKDKPANLYYRDGDILVGNVLIVGCDDHNFISLPDRGIKEVMHWVKLHRSVLKAQEAVMKEAVMKEAVMAGSEPIE